jgi:hypothetical protein
MPASLPTSSYPFFKACFPHDYLYAPSDGHHPSLCCCFFTIFVLLCYSRRLRLRPHEQSRTLAATSLVKKAGHKQMASRWCSSANYWEHLLRYEPLGILSLIYSTISRFLVRMFRAHPCPPPNIKKDVRRQPGHHCRVYPFDSHSQG